MGSAANSSEGKLHPNAALIDEFYRAFSQRDHQAMAACYLPNATFSDPVFPDLKGDEVTSMWRMLCERGTDLEVTWNDVDADDQQGSAHWDAHYTFSTGRKVHNIIRAEFVFRDGKIAQHRDRFDFYRWSRMALGPLGIALGWSPLLRKRVQQQADRQLRKFMASST